MVQYLPQVGPGKVFHALSHPLRCEVLTACCHQPRTTTELSRLCTEPITLTGLRKHLAVLENAGLLTRHKRGRTVWCHAELGPLAMAEDYLASLRAFWTTHLDHLATHLEDR